MRISRGSGRRAFTLIELLVVLAILALLAALTTSAVMRYFDVGSANATRSNLKKVRQTLTVQWQAVREQAQKDVMDSSANQNSLYYGRATAAAGPGVQERVRQQYVRLRLAQAFPASFAEAFWPDPAVKPALAAATAPYAWEAYVRYLNKLGVRPDNESTWGSVPLDVQQAVCLLMILEAGPKNTTVTADDLKATAVGTLDLGSGLPQARGIVDGWRRPVYFTRTYQGQDATPALLSAGADGLLGTDANFTVTNAAQARDNIVAANQ